MMWPLAAPATRYRLKCFRYVSSICLMRGESLILRRIHLVSTTTRMSLNSTTKAKKGFACLTKLTGCVSARFQVPTCNPDCSARLFACGQHLRLVGAFGNGGEVLMSSDL